MIDALDIRVRGIVQGVGFRPFVYRLAKRYLVSGWVLNDRDGVFIHAEAEPQLIDGFVTELHMNPPAAAKITEVELTEVPLSDCKGFEIRESADEDADESTLISADLGVCDDCLRELYDEGDRRYRYPFINCTNCGPRFTIIDELPYNRPATSMRDFPMCDDCASEYADPADRRFHAQPDACFECGPQVSWQEIGSDRVIWGNTREAADGVFVRAVDALMRGGILAVKGLGGFHLVCDAANEEAIAELRRRKRRDGKAFAVMAADVEAVRAVCEVSEAEEALLKSAARPIVLLKKRAGAALAAGLADGLPELGVMLAATPVQSLLAHDMRAATGSSMLVMTSGNVHDEPIVTDDAEALSKLGGIADAILGNNREILARYDDSVARVVKLGSDEAIQFIRRARGWAPVPIALAPAMGAAADGGALAAPVVFAAGSEQKNTFTYLRAGEAFVSQHVGDMEDADVYDAWLESKARFEKLFDVRPDVLACDLHPEYLASKWARDEAARTGLPLVEVQHHHAHIASVLAEHGLFGPCCGIAFDGTGYGADGAIWGGEVLIANQADYERFANFTYVPMPGGAAAVKHPLRMAYGVLWAYDLLEHPGAQPALEALGEQAALCEQMIERGLNTPYTSSAGRLFDAVSALLGVCTEPTYEGEPAILLDAACQGAGAGASTEHSPRYQVTVTKNAATEDSTAHDTSVVLFDAEPVVRGVLDDLVAGVPAADIALAFHRAMVDVVVQAAELVRAMYDISLVALSGGCFMNRFLLEQSASELGERGFTVAVNGNLPPNDGCVSLGQAALARATR
ncbi:MAG: carbamoyltransferase HypF [Eggerthellaceae bacterium]|nr:carbamoyltransferase HypF [Eggerthellaceae bacterium]